MAIIDITVYYDTVCPWCYIGHRILDRALELYQRTYPGGSSDTVNFKWMPFYLLPDAPTQGVPMLDRIAQKNGTERVNAITTRLERVGRDQGILFSFRGRTGNTRDSHRLVAFAKSKGLEQQKRLIEQIYESHFEHGGDITSHEMLIKAAVAAGLAEAEARVFLESHQGGDEVDKLASQARQDGVSSVPTVYIGTQRIEGADDASSFYEALIAARQENSST